MHNYCRNLLFYFILLRHTTWLSLWFPNLYLQTYLSYQFFVACKNSVDCLRYYNIIIFGKSICIFSNIGYSRRSQQEYFLNFGLSRLLGVHNLLNTFGHRLEIAVPVYAKFLGSLPRRIWKSLQIAMANLFYGYADNVFSQAAVSADFRACSSVAKAAHPWFIMAT